MPVGASAEKVVTSGDGKRLTITLRKDLRWSNGAKVRAEDFVYSLRRLLSSTTDSWAAELLFDIRGAEEYHGSGLIDPVQLGIEAKDDTTLILELRQPNAALIDVLTLPVTSPVQQETVDRIKGDWTTPENWVGNGPFILVKQTPSVIVLAKNPNHRLAGSVELDEIQIFIVSNREEGSKLYSENRVDQFGYRDFGLSSSALSQYVGKPDLIYQSDLRTFFVRLNTTKLPLSSLSLRQALAMSVNRNLLSDSFSSEGEKSAFSLVPDGVKDYDAPRGYLYNVPGAIKLLRDLGYCAKEEGNSKCKTLPVLSMIYRDSAKMRKLALALEAIWKRTIGLEGIKIEPKKEDEYQKAIRGQNYTLALDELAALPEEPFAFLESFRSTSPGGFSNKSYDELLDAAQSERKWDNAKGFYRRAEALLLREGGIVPLLHASTPILISGRIRGYEPNIWDQHPFANLSIVAQ